MMSTRHRVALVACLMLAAHAAWAQAVYRSVGPDGRVTYSDQPPPAEAPASNARKTASNGADNTSAGGLPYVLRQASGQFPVTLYTGPNCAPCGAGRALLASRGVPFAEYTVSTQQDVSALTRLSGGNTLPFVTIGGQHLRGYADAEWNQYLDLAGYPKQSQLPPGFRNAPATPLTQPEPEPVQPVPAPRPVPQAAPQPRTSPDNPAGIQF